MAKDQTRTSRRAVMRAARRSPAVGTTGRLARVRQRTVAARRGYGRPEVGRPMAGSSVNGLPVVRWATVPVPVPVGVQVPAAHLPHVDLPSSAKAAVQQAARAVDTVRTNLPAPKRLVYYGALGVMAAVGALEWPVAAAIGAGVWVASRTGQRPARLGGTQRLGTGRFGQLEGPGKAGWVGGIPAAQPVGEYLASSGIR